MNAYFLRQDFQKKDFLHQSLRPSGRKEMCVFFFSWRTLLSGQSVKELAHSFSSSSLKVTSAKQSPMTGRAGGCTSLQSATRLVSLQVMPSASF